jgi:hypothetical protein
MRSVLDDVEGTAAGADNPLSKSNSHGYASFSGAWSEQTAGSWWIEGGSRRRMVSVLRRNCYDPGQVSWLRSGTSFWCRVCSFPSFKAEWIVGDSSSFTVAGPHRDCTGLPFSALAGTLGLISVVPRRRLLGRSPPASITDLRPNGQAWSLRSSGCRIFRHASSLAE